MIAEGESRGALSWFRAVPGTTATVSAQAVAGYAIREGSVDLEFVSGLYAEFLAPSRLLVGEQLEIAVRQVVPPAPKGGLKAQMDSSAPSVLKVIVNEASVSGENLYPQTTPSFQIQAIAPGNARLQLSGVGFTASQNNITVVKPTELTIEAVSESGKIAVGEGLVGKVRLRRKNGATQLPRIRQPDCSRHLQDSSVCTAQSVYIPYWQDTVEVPVIGYTAGVTKLHASAEAQ